MAPSVHNYLIFKMMKIDILLGLQWGDEGKGKVVDVLTSRYDLIARFQGGPNAGHSLEFNGIRHVLHIIPSGIFHKEKMNIIGNGVVIDPVIFEEEIQALEKMGCTPTENLRISRRAHLILPTHRVRVEKGRPQDRLHPQGHRTYLYGQDRSHGPARLRPAVTQL